MKYMIINSNTAWYKRYDGTEEEAIAETERMSEFHGCQYSLLDDTGRLIGKTYIPEPVYIFLKG